MANTNLHKAKEAKNDEFYTMIEDVSNELKHYKHHFKDKIVFCNCDDPTWSAFWRYFHLNFSELGLKKLISTHYDRENPTYKMEYTGGDDNNVETGIKTNLQGNGDFRNQECLELLDECDIVVTNEPFSLFRNYIEVLMNHSKKFLIIGNKNAITYKEFFPLLKDNKVWMGVNNVQCFLQPDGSIKKFGNIGWFTNLDIAKRHESIILWKKYTPEDYPTYDNYDAINVDKVAEIPIDYCESWEVTKEEFEHFDKEKWEIVRNGNRSIETYFIIPSKGTELRRLLSSHENGYKEKIEEELGKTLQYCTGILGVPITFLDKHNPEQFEIIKFRKGNDEKDLTYTLKNGNDLTDRQTDRQTDNSIFQSTCQKDTVTELSEYQLHSRTNIAQNNLESLDLTDTQSQQNYLLEEEVPLMEKQLMQEYLFQRYCNGIMGVPITFMDKYNPTEFEIIGTDEAEGIGFSNGLYIENSKYKQCHANGRRIYKRIFIYKKGNK